MTSLSLLAGRIVDETYMKYSLFNMTRIKVNCLLILLGQVYRWCVKQSVMCISRCLPLVGGTSKSGSSFVYYIFGRIFNSLFKFLEKKKQNMYKLRSWANFL